MASDSLEQLQPCGHSHSEIVSEDEGTAYCGECQLVSRERTPRPSRPYVVVVDRDTVHGKGSVDREEIAHFRDRQDALLFLNAYNNEHVGSSYHRADLRELRYDG